MSGIFQNISGRLTLRQPPLTSVRNGAILARESGDFSQQTILELLLNDPITAVSVLKRANQSFYGLRASVGSLSHAVEIVGASTCLGLMADTPGPSTNHPGLSRIVRHASIVSQISHRLANGTWFSDGFSPRPGVVATAGLLHSVGRIALWHSFPMEAASIYGFSDIPFPLEGSKTELEQLQFGTDHLEMGEFVARKMHYPLELIDAIRQHAKPQDETLAPAHAKNSLTRLSRIVGSAVVLANEAGYGLDPQVSFMETTGMAIIHSLESDPAMASGEIDRVRQEMHQDPWLAALPASYEQTSKHSVRPAIRASDRAAVIHAGSSQSKAEKIFATNRAD